MNRESPLLLATVLTCVVSFPAQADVGPMLDRLVAAAQIVHVDAVDMQADLDRHDADLAAVARHVTGLQQRAGALDAVLTALAERHSDLPPAHREVLQLARRAVMSMRGLLDHKADILSRTDTDTIDLRVLRAKAESVRTRAAWVESDVTLLRP